MKTLCFSGYQCSSIDQKALDHYLLVSGKDWAQAALNGMINKAVKSILRDYLDLYRSKSGAGEISNDRAVLIPAIVSMEEFKPYNYRVPAMPAVNRKSPPDQEIWSGGFQVQDYEDVALRAFYSDPEAQLRWFMTNKICCRRQAMAKIATAALMLDKSRTTMPAHEDDVIAAYAALPGYKTRALLDQEMG